jgi:Mg-chelatase subunit ChlD
MNNEFPIDPRQALETSLTALILGELPDDQARFLRQAIATDPELAKSYERLKKTIELVRETETSPEGEPVVQSSALKLDERRRQQLWQRFKTVKPVEFKQPERLQVSWLVPAAAALAVLLAVATLLFYTNSKPKFMAQRGRTEVEIQERLERLNSRSSNGAMLPTQQYADAGTKPTDHSSVLNGLDNRPRSLPVSTTPSTPLQWDSASGKNFIFLPAESQQQTLTLSPNSTVEEKRDWNFALVPAPLAQTTPAQKSEPAWSTSATLRGIFDDSTATQADNRRQLALSFGDTPTLGRGYQANNKDEMAARVLTRSTDVSGIAGQVPALSTAEAQKGTTTYFSDGGFGGFSTIAALKPEEKLADLARVPVGVADTGVLQEPSQVTNEGKPVTTADSDAFRLKEGRVAGLEDSKPGQALQAATSVQGGRSSTGLGFGLAVPERESAKVTTQLGAMAARGEADGMARGDQVVVGKPTVPLRARRLAEVDALKEGKDKTAAERTQAPAAELEAAPAKNSPVAVVGDLKKQSSESAVRMKSALKDSAQVDQEDLAAPKPATPPPVPQPEVSARDNPFSTFSLNVSDVSFKLAAASLEKGVIPEPGSIRSEEFINAFDYHDPQPAGGAPVAFDFERARYPFAQNRDVLRFSIKTGAAGRIAGQPLNVVLLLDNSGSMERADRVRIVHEALQVLATQLTAQDTFSVVTFARTARLWVDGVHGDQAGRIAEELSGLTPEGGTNLGEALTLAYQAALRHYSANGINRVVLLTDGAANLGDTNPEALKKTVETNRKQGIALDCFGVGWEGYNDDLLETLTRNGDGRYGFLNTPEDAASGFAGQLAGALHVAASDVKVQVEFNPNRVTSYRQIGYARHQLTKEQFRDNTVDAAEIGAAESGNALYVVETNPQGDGPLAMVRVRYKVPGTSDYREHEWAVPFTGAAMPVEQSTAPMRLAVAASAFSEWLSSSPYAIEVTPDRLLFCLNSVPASYGADPRPQKLEWMVRQAKALSGK